MYYYLCIKREQPNITKEKFYEIMYEFNDVYSPENDIDNFENIVKNGRPFLLKIFKNNSYLDSTNFLDENKILWEVIPTSKIKKINDNPYEKYYYFNDYIYINDSQIDYSDSKCVVIEPNQNQLCKSDFEQELIQITKLYQFPIYEYNDFEYCINGGSEFILFTHSSIDLLNKLIDDLTLRKINACIKNHRDVNLYLKRNEVNINFRKDI